MPISVMLKPYSFYDSKEKIQSQLGQRRVDIFSDGFDIEHLGNGTYRITLPNPPENYLDIFKEIGEII